MIDHPSANFNMTPQKGDQNENPQPQQTLWQKIVTIILVALIAVVIIAIAIIVIGSLTALAIKTIQWVISLL